MTDPADKPEPLSHKIAVIVVREVAEQAALAAREALGRWHRDRLARKREREQKRD